jgi:ornithine cyclodeaminase
MRIVSLAEIRAVLDEDEALAAIERGFRRLWAGEAQVAAVGHLAFQQPPGDCHVKSAHLAGDDVFIVKVATSFYQNPALGLPSSNGFMAVISTRTGEIAAILHDQGFLTDQRTAMAGAIAARAIARRSSVTLGIVGAGTQAHLQARLIARVLGLRRVLIWSRNFDRATTLAAKLNAQAATHASLDAVAVQLPELCARADLIVTTTPSREPLLMSEMIRSGARIVAVGADSPGKQELDSQLLARARIVVDSRAQCIDHGDTGWAVRAGIVAPDTLIELGAHLQTPAPFPDDEIVVADLTGIAIQDVEIAKTVWRRLERESA